MDQRMRALCDMAVALMRDGGGRHEYDGVVQDLSPAGVASGLAALGGPAYDDPYDDALVAAKEAEARAVYGELQMHRWNPLLHVQNLDLASYDREYAPAAERADARARHLAAWPDGVAAALDALDQVTAPVAAATVDAARGLAAGLVRGRDAAEDAALDAQARLVAHLEAAAVDGSPDAALGGAALTRLLSAAEATPVDLAELAAQADAERDRLQAMAAAACERIEPGRPPAELLPELLRDHPDPDGVLAETRALTEEVIAWTKEHDLAPYHDGECRVGVTPESRQWAVAMMSWAAPGEPPGPSWYHVTPPRPEWSAAEQSEWLQLFSRTTLPAITVHEVAPGHFSHGVALRHASSLQRQLALSEAFTEGWAHYVEEVAVEEGFHADDPRFALGVAVEALVRVTRLACAIGLHTGTMTVDDATRRFERDAFLAGPAARSEAQRGTFDPTYGRYTWGKLTIRALRERARSQWDGDFSLPRFHKAMLDLGAPPLGLLEYAL
ncbi:MAG: hypothetical protein V7637_3793 [Mycobacteriales bacterium]|jgi:hypothetical protein